MENSTESMQFHIRAQRVDLSFILLTHKIQELCVQHPPTITDEQYYEEKPIRNNINKVTDIPYMFQFNKGRLTCCSLFQIF